MATIAGHLSVDALRERYVSSSDALLARHFQTIWLLAKGHTIAEVARMTSFGSRWIEQLVARYNAEGPESHGDLRRRNGTSATISNPNCWTSFVCVCRSRPVTAANGRARRSRPG